MFSIFYILSKLTILKAKQPEPFAQKHLAMAQHCAAERHSDLRPRAKGLGVALSAPQFKEKMIKYKK